MNKLAALTMIGLLLLAACSKSKQTATEHTGHGGAGSEHASHTAQPVAASVTKAIWKLSPEKPQPNKTTAISIDIQDAQGKPVTKFELNHEKYMHLIIVSKDLSYFSHIHPEHKEGGAFKVDTALPSAGDYKLIADYVPSGGAASTQSTWMKVEGAPSAQAAIVPESSLVKTVDGKRITLALDKLKAGTETVMTFHLTDELSGKPITDLQPYLGAVGHVVILSENTEQYLHVHPTDERAAGPDAKFSTTFPGSGVYKIWGQFKRDGQLSTVSFVVNVPGL